MNFMSKSLIIYSKIFPYIKRERKLQIFLSIFISIFVSIFESLGIGTLFPFIASLIDPNKIYNINFIKNILIYFNIDKSNLAIIFGSTFILLVLLSSTLKIVLLIKSRYTFSGSPILCKNCLLDSSKLTLLLSGKAILSGLIIYFNYLSSLSKLSDIENSFVFL